MTKVMKNYWVDIILFISGAACIGTGYVLDFHLTSTREVAMIIKKIHLWTGYTMSFAVFIHLMLHIGWIKNVTCRKFPPSEN